MEIYYYFTNQESRSPSLLFDHFMEHLAGPDVLDLLMDKIIKYQGLYMEESSLEAPWKLFTRILNEVFLFSFSPLWSTILTGSFSTLCKILSELRILFTPDLKSCPEVRHIVSLRFSKVSLI